MNTATLLSHRWYTSDDYLRADAKLSLADIEAGNWKRAQVRLEASLRTNGTTGTLGGIVMRAANWLSLGQPGLAWGELQTLSTERN